MRLVDRVALLLVAGALMRAQSQPAPQKQTIIVTGTYEPLPLEEADRPVRALDAEALRPLTNTWADLLRLDSSVDLRQRSSNGVQGDLSIRGGTFGQTLVLLDGMRLNDVRRGIITWMCPRRSRRSVKCRC